MRTSRSISLTPKQRAQLQSLLRKGSGPVRMQARARILLLTDRSQPDRLSDAAVAKATFTSESTIKRVRRRFLEEGLEAALREKPRPGATPKVTGDIEAKLFLLACSPPPKGHAHWSIRLLADRMVELAYVDSLAPSTVAEHLKRGRSSPGM